ncbi:polysaccharide deacetylase family protein [Candidatus Nitrosacidococcus tergens]|uniref:Polysaccharide deacetylase n=1 Tax=Candidatus Nitrosacidococcus tergens TaxID=553981 RepID=A0A7G1QAK4_9GAMM|nr:polysaccharide deacetylase family protein [Candidatus Nitrosacidococcus tergens]CAB1276759.1 Polysaccharide deacetylase [Candidatus Nitrosacidococcus tergens]
MTSLFTAYPKKFCSLLKGNRLSILIYHQILSKPDPLRQSALDIIEFECQMAMVKKYFSVLSLSEAIERLHKNSLPKCALCITFDDGYRDNVTNALPILKRHNLCASFFITSKYLEGGQMWNDTIIEVIRNKQGGILDLNKYGLGNHNLATIKHCQQALKDIIPEVKYMDYLMRQEVVAYLLDLVDELPLEDFMMKKNDIITLKKAGMEIGGHTRSHPILSQISFKEAREEIYTNKEELEGVLGDPIHIFAYPNGRPNIDFNKNHIKMVKNAGYKGAVTISRGAARSAIDSYQIPRFTPWDRTPLCFMFRLIHNSFYYQPEVCK